MPNRLLAICFDFGDTLIDEGSEIKDEALTTLQADLIPGISDMLHELKRRGYPLAIVSNGPVGSIANVLEHHGLYHLFDACAISQGLGIEKPDPRIFQHVLNHLEVPPEHVGRTVMVGNDLAADVAGANGVGMISVLLTWAPRRRRAPAGEVEVPQYIVEEPLALLPLLDQLEQQLGGQRREP